MFKVTRRLKRYASERLGVKKGASESDVRVAVAKALASKKMSPARLDRLTAEKGRKAGEGGGKKGNSDLEKHLGTLAKTVGDLAKIVAKDKAGDDKGGKGKKQKDRRTDAEKAVDKRLKDLGVLSGDGPDAQVAVGPQGLLARSAPYLKNGGVRVREALERYDGTRAKAVCPDRCGKNGTGSFHPRAGQEAMHPHDNRVISHPSERDKAVVGAFFKWSLECHNEPRDIPRALKMTDHDREIVNYALHEERWTGLINGEGTEDYGCKKVEARKLTQVEVKALLDDSTSGGITAAPLVFDDAVILTPVLFGEIYPLVNVVNITRGRRIEGFSMGNPTFTSGVAEGTSITPFNTAAFIAAFDTTVFVAVAAMEIGLDFEEDAPNDIGGLVVERYGLKSMEWLDRVVAVGDGVTEPQGAANAAAVTVVNSDNGTGGGATVGDYEGLMFGVAKAFRREPGAQTAFLANETTYRRARAIPVGPNDERRVFGMTHADYMLLDQPYKIQINIPNSQILFGNWKRYRMYRRLGLNVRIETAGNYLAIRNLKLIVMRMRYGGQIELGGAFALMPDAEA